MLLLQRHRIPLRTAWKLPTANLLRAETIKSGPPPPPHHHHHRHHHHHHHHRPKVSGWGKREKRTIFLPARLIAVVRKERSVDWESCMASRLVILCRREAVITSHQRLQQWRQAQVSSLGRSESLTRFPLPRLVDILRLSPGRHHRRRPSIALRQAANTLAINLIPVRPSRSSSTISPRAERSRGLILSAMRSGRREFFNNISHFALGVNGRMPAALAGGAQDQEELQRLVGRVRPARSRQHPAINPLARNLVVCIPEQCQQSSTTLPQAERLRSSTLMATRHGRRALTKAASPHVLRGK